MGTGISLNITPLKNAAALLHAAQSGDLAAIYTLMAQHPWIAGPGNRDANRNTALMLAAASGHFDCVKAFE